MSSTKKGTKDDVPAETDPYLALALTTYKLTCHPDPVSLETAQYVVTAGLWPSFLLMHKTPFEMDRQSVVGRHAMHVRPLARAPDHDVEVVPGIFSFSFLP